MRFDPLVPVPVVIAGGALMAGFVIARVVRRRPIWAIVRGLLMSLAVVAIALDPTVDGGSSEARRVAANVVFVVDSTASMAAIDYDGGAQRLDGVRADILELAEEFRGATFSLVRFDSQARLELPWTTDHAALETAVSVIRQERAVYSRGSALDLPLAVLGEMLPPVTFGVGEGDDPYVVMFYFSDGEQRVPPPADVPKVDTQTGMILAENDGTQAVTTSFADLAEHVDGGGVLGYGTEDGAPMIEFHGVDEIFTSRAQPYVVDYSTDQPAISRIDEANLGGIAEDLGVPYLHRTEPGGLGSMASRLADAAPRVDDGDRETRERLYWIPAFALLAVVLWQTAATATEARAMNRTFGGALRPSATRVPGERDVPAAADVDGESAA